MSDPHAPTPPEPLPATTLFCDALGSAGLGDTVRLASEEIAHVRALRLAIGDRVLVTDGRGRRRAAEIVETGRRSVACLLGDARPAPAARPVSLWAPVGNKDRSLWLVEKAVELGVRGVRLIEFTRSRSVADAGRSDGFLDRARRRAIAALTQSGGADLPALLGPDELGSVLSAGSVVDGAARWVADPDGAPILDAVAGTAPGPAVWLVGPEGGLTADERRLALGAGFEPVALGPRTLRFETAAVAGLAVICARLDGAAGGWRDA